MYLKTILLLPAITFLISLLFYKTESVKKYLNLIVYGILFYYGIILYKQIGTNFGYNLNFSSLSVNFNVTYLGYFFTLMITGLTFLTVLFYLKFMKDENAPRDFYIWLAIKTFGMLGVVFASDLFTFFLMWEVMSWSTYFVMRKGENTQESSFKYLIYAVSSGMLLLVGLTITYNTFGTFDFAQIHNALSGASVSLLFLLAVIFIGSFAIESAVFPLHSWLPDSYSNTFSPITSYLTGISTRIGVFAIIIFLFNIIGMENINKLVIFKGISLMYILGLISAITIIIPTFTALEQYDAKKLVTWHGIGQGGYMILGLASGTALGIAGGIFHIVNHLTYVSLILFSVAAVEYRTGTTNLNKLGGLIKKMPIEFLGLLIGIIALAGIPPMNGFVSKWMIYKTLILTGHPILAIAAVIGTLGTILSVYKLIHNIFLGQLPPEYNNIKEAPFILQIPIIVLMIVVYVLGVYPGIALSLIAKIQSALNLPAVNYTLHGVSKEVGELNMNVINLVFLGGIIVAYLIYLLGNKRRHVSQYNNYAAGHFLTEKTKYNFNYKFYAALDHVISPWKKRIIERTEKAIISFTENFGEYFRRIYTGNLNTYTMYILTAFVISIIILKELL